MNRFNKAQDLRVPRRRSPVPRKILFLLSGIALLLLVALPPAVANAALCPPPTPAKPNVARPRAQATGQDLNGGDLAPGDEILWTITVKNLGSVTLTDIIITDMIPEWTTYVDGSIEGPGANDTGDSGLTWIVDALETGEKVTLTFRTRVDDNAPDGTCITNKASADPTQTPAGVSKAVSMKVVVSSETPSASSSKAAPEEKTGNAYGPGDAPGPGDEYDPVLAATGVGQMIHQFALALKLGPDGLDLMGFLARLVE